MQRILSCLLLLALCLSLLPQAQAAQVEVDAPSAILMDAATGTVLFEKNAHEQLAPASVTKVMTLLLVMEALESGRISWEDSVIASEHAAGKGGSQVYLEVGEAMSMDDMLKSVVVSSANDCATALAEHVAGSESAFVELMNQKATELGCQETHFVNCTGLDDEDNAKEHLTSAYDLALMSRALLRHDRIRNYTTIWMDTVRGGKFGLSNTNKLVRFYEGATGLKTGYTSSAGHCLSATAKRDGLELIAVVMHCASSTERFQSAKTLLDYGFANYALVDAVPDAPLQPIPVRLGKQTSILPIVQSSSPILIEKGERSMIRRTVTLAPELNAPIKEGAQLGTLTIETDSRILAQIPILAPEKVEKVGLWQITRRLLRKLCMG
ncbi:MAG: D-alanyl-D-alanine carboxypeptidase [Ruminococcaceae bacterium]|nr:D-alanyl-D-alanine carboxypeptidase [Oscillospiraceae bacterium]